MSRKIFDDSFACHREMSRLVSLSTRSDFNRRSRAVWFFLFFYWTYITAAALSKTLYIISGISSNTGNHLTRWLKSKLIL